MKFSARDSAHTADSRVGHANFFFNRMRPMTVALAARTYPLGAGDAIASSFAEPSSG